MLIDNLNLIANGTFNGYVVTNEGQLTLKDTEMSTHGNSNSNAQIVNKLSGAIYMDGINLLRKE